MSPMRKEFEEAYTRFLKMKKEHPELNHNGHEPVPRNYGFKPGALDAWEVGKIKERVEREMMRTK